MVLEKMKRIIKNIMGEDVRYTSKYIEEMDCPELKQELGRVIDTCVIEDKYFLIILKNDMGIELVRGLYCEICSTEVC